MTAKPLPSILDVAKAAGVSKSTTARVLSGEGAASPKAREKVLAAAESLRYRVNLSARVLRSGHNRLLGLVVPSSEGRGVISHAVTAQKLEGVARGAERLGYDLQIFFADLSDPEVLRRLAIEKSIAAFLFTGQIPTETLELLDQYRIPWIGINWCNPKRPNDPHCWTDFVHAGRTLTQHMVEIGCRRLLALDWLSDDYGPFGAGVRQAWAELKMPTQHLTLHVGRKFQVGASVDLALREALDARAPSMGLLMSYEGAAQSAYRELRARGLTPGRDVAVATFDDLGTAIHMDPPCTAYAQPTYEMGEAAVEEIDRLLAVARPSGLRGAVKIVRDIPGELRVRASTQLFRSAERAERLAN